MVALANGAAIGQNLHVTQDGANSFTIRLPSPAGGLTPAGLWSLVVIYVLLFVGIAIYIFRRCSWCAHRELQLAYNVERKRAMLETGLERVKELYEWVHSKGY